MRIALFVLLSALAVRAESLALLPLEPKPGVLDAQHAAELDRELRATAETLLKPHGWALTASDAATPRDPKAALAATHADAVVLGRATVMEGATVIGLALYRTGSAAPAANVRIAGIGAAQLREDVEPKLAKLFAAGLGFEAPKEAPPLPKGTLRLPPHAAAPAQTRPQPPQPAATKQQPAEATAPQEAEPQQAAPQEAQQQQPARAERAAAEPVPQEPAAASAPQATPQPAPQTRPQPAPQLAPEQPTTDPTVRMIREVTAELERVRGLQRKQNLKVQIVDDQRFLEALHEKARKELTPQVVAMERARWMAFDLAPANADPGEILMGVLDEQVAGFYDPFTKTLIVRRDPPASAGGAESLPLVLAHEIEHALQDQNFGFPDFNKLPDDDVRMARLALYEGDAMAAMTAVGARRAHKPLRATMAAAAEAMRVLDIDTLLKMSGHSPALASAPPIVREELGMPYTAGFTLVVDAWQRGGFALVDRMFRNPPQSTHQVLHPEAYYAGEAPVPLAPPAAPPGTRAIATGRLGELGSRVALETCVDRSVARDFVEHWAGDAYTVALAPDRTLSVVWSTAWSRGAPQVANVLRMEEPCWDEQISAGPSRSGWMPPATARMKQDGDRVVVVRGLTPAQQDVAIRGVLAVKPATPAAAPPLGVVPEPPKTEAARVDGGVFHSPRLALEAPVPKGYTAAPSKDAELVLTKKDAGVAVLQFVPDALGDEAKDAFFQTAAASAAATFAGGNRLSFVGRTKAELAGEPAEMRTWTIEGRDQRLHIAVAPFCDGKAALAFLSIENADATNATFDRFAQTLKRSGKAPACAELE